MYKSDKNSGYTRDKKVCSGCTNLAEISECPDLTDLNCSGCKSLTQLPEFPALRELNCDGCRSLTHIPEFPALRYLTCSDCPWLDRQNPGFQHNISCLIRLQKWVRKWRKFRILRTWLKTEEFAQWYYHPENPGGLRQKVKLGKIVSSIENTLQNEKLKGKDSATFHV